AGRATSANCATSPSAWPWAWVTVWVTGAGGGGIEPLAEQMDRIEKQLVEDALARCGGRVGETADKLGITRKTLYLKMRHHGLQRGDFAEE
ncbi:helix-turn-helix domain-containing protein, partial [Azospirillum brasilense]|uniref:helix-turn-helix domain-containing protein n=1 Tax=Azospirillum brasilense TaxID=192 RepID=UPI002495140A